MRLTPRQLNYCRLVADGMSEHEAVLEAGYAPGTKSNTLNKLRNHARVQAQIEYYKKSDADEEVADKHSREKFWTAIMNNPSCNDTVRLKASEYLGKAQGDFVNNNKVELTDGGKPIIVVPDSSPKQWEEYWESKND